VWRGFCRYFRDRPRHGERRLASLSAVERTQINIVWRLREYHAASAPRGCLTSTGKRLSRAIAIDRRRDTAPSVAGTTGLRVLAVFGLIFVAHQTNCARPLPMKAIVSRRGIRQTGVSDESVAGMHESAAVISPRRKQGGNVEITVF